MFDLRKAFSKETANLIETSGLRKPPFFSHHPARTSTCKAGYLIRGGR